MTFKELFQQTPLIAILRGLQPQNAVATGAVLIEAGFGLIEVPLNSPEAELSIRLLSEAFGDRALIGGGTVLTPEDVDSVASAGGVFVVSPNVAAEVIRETKRRGLVSLPGIATPSEAFTALQHGADGLKVFPAELVPPKGIKAMRAVLPGGVPLIPVGSIDDSNMQGYLQAGAAGFGFGGSLYKPDYALEDISTRAIKLVAAYRRSTAV